MLNPTNQSVHVPSIFSLTALALDVAKSHHVIDRVTIVRWYAELSVMYPEHCRYREALVSALNRLSDALEVQGKQAIAQMRGRWRTTAATRTIRGTNRWESDGLCDFRFIQATLSAPSEAMPLVGEGQT